MTISPSIPWAKPNFWHNEQKYVADALTSTWISGGSYVERFEYMLAEICGVPYMVVVSNGTTALHLAYLALGIGPGDEVIVPGFAFMAAANIALHVGATPIFAEVDPETWCLDANDVERNVSPRTKAIVPVHTYGNMCDMDAICGVASAHGVSIIEDAAESFASRYRHRVAGSMGLMGTLSFQATKTITTGEGGAVFTVNADLHDRMRLYRSHGMKSKRYWHEVAGHNFRLTNVQAAIGCAQLEELDVIIRERERVRSRYVERLSLIDGIAMQRFASDVAPVLWAMAVKLDPQSFPQGRDGVMAQLSARNIETRPGFFAASMMDIYSCPHLPICEDVSRTVISLPTFPTLTDKEVDRICDELERLKA